MVDKVRDIGRLIIVLIIRLVKPDAGTMLKPFGSRHALLSRRELVDH